MTKYMKSSRVLWYFEQKSRDFVSQPSVTPLPQCDIHKMYDVLPRLLKNGNFRPNLFRFEFENLTESFKTHKHCFEMDEDLDGRTSLEILEGMGKLIREPLEKFVNRTYGKKDHYIYLTFMDFQSWVWTTPRFHIRDLFRRMSEGKIYVIENPMMIKNQLLKTLLVNPVFRVVWEPPPLGWHKLNFHGSYWEEKTRAGYIFRDENGEVVFLHRRDYNGMTKSTFEAELMALYFGIVEALELGIEKILIEGDCEQVIRMLEMKKLPPPEYTELFSTIYYLLGSFQEWSASIIFPEGNSVANFLGSLGNLDLSEEKEMKNTARKLALCDNTTVYFRFEQNLKTIGKQAKWEGKRQEKKKEKEKEKGKGGD